MSIDEAIEKHSELNQKLFDGDKLKPEVRAKAEEVVNEFIRLLVEDEIKLEVRDVILTGSNASYNYTKNSDIDLHILAKTVDLDDPEKLYPKLYNAYRRLFEGKFDITFYGIPVEVYVETEDNPVISNGVYSVMFDKWVKTPKQENVPEIDQKAIDEATKPWLDRANELLKTLDNNMPDGDEQIDKFLEDLYEMRHKGIYDTAGSEYSEENLVFKEVRNSGVMEKLKELRNKIIERKLSLEEGIKYLDEANEILDYGTGDVVEDDVIDVNKASTFSTQDLLRGSKDAAYEGVTYDIVEMTPEQYFELCSKVQRIPADDLISFVSQDTRRLDMLRDVLLKYKKKFPLPFVSFSKMYDVAGQEGRHRMYVLGELFGWDKEFPVMLVQDKSNKKSLGTLLNEAVLGRFELPETQRREYVIKIAQLTGYQPIVHTNGVFEIHNVKELDAQRAIGILRRQDFVEYAQTSAERYDFSDITSMVLKGLPPRYFNITGKVRI